ncbi:MAG: site-2 protease family protein [Chitinophagales bacterium]
MAGFLVLGIVALVLVHEAGHYLAAMFGGLKVEEVGLGFGPVVGSSGKAKWRLLPLGGYVKLAPFRSAWEALYVSLAGPLANLLLAYLLIVAGLFHTGIPAAGGVWSRALAVREPWQVVRWAWLILAGFVRNTAAGLLELFRDVRALAGPVWLIKAGAPFLASDPWNLLALLALCSLSVGLFNLLPFPGLDGAQAFLRLLPEKAREKAAAVGVRARFGLALVLTV